MTTTGEITKLDERLYTHREDGWVLLIDGEAVEMNARSVLAALRPPDPSHTHKKISVVWVRST